MVRLLISTGEVSGDLQGSLLIQALWRVAKRRGLDLDCLLYTSPSPRDVEESRMPSSA